MAVLKSYALSSANRWLQNAPELRVCCLLLPLSFAAFTASNAQTAQQHGDSQVNEAMHQAIAAAEHGDESRALSLTSSLLAEHPNFEPGLKLQGMLLEDMGRFEQADASYRQALKLAPNDTELLMKIGAYKLVAGDKVEAISLFTRLLKLKPHDADALFYLAQAYHLNGNNALALKTIQECVKLEPTNAPALQKYGELLISSGDNEGALQWLQKARAADPTLPRMDFDMGVANFQGMHLDDAVHYATKAVEQQPNNLTALALLAAADVKLSQWKDAEPIFQKILAAKPDDVSALLGLGHCDLELKNYQSSIDALNHLLQLDPTQMLAHFYLSRDYMGLHKPAEAQQEADLHSRMMQLASSAAAPADTAQEKVIWAKARQLLNENREAEALQLFRADSRGPSATPGEPYVFVGALYLYMGRADDAVKSLKHAMAIEPGVQGAHTYLGIMALQQGDLNTAESEFQAELAHTPNYQLAIAELGEVRYRQERWSEAAEQLSRSKTIEPSLLYMLCDSYFHLGKVSDADVTAELISAYAKDNPQVMQGVIDLLNRNNQTALAQRLASKMPPATDPPTSGAQ